MEGLLIEFIQPQLGIATASLNGVELDIVFEDSSEGAKITSIKVSGKGKFDWSFAPRVEGVLRQYLKENY